MRNLPPALVSAIRTPAEATPGLIAVWVFGSTATGSTSPRDLDVALLWDEETDPPLRWRPAERLALSVERGMADPRSVDLVDLRDAPPALQHRILTEGIRVFDRDPIRRIRFEAITLSIATDFVEWQKPFLEAWRRTVANGR